MTAITAAIQAEEIRKNTERHIARVDALEQIERKLTALIALVEDFDGDGHLVEDNDNMRDAFDELLGTLNQADIDCADLKAEVEVS